MSMSEDETTRPTRRSVLRVSAASGVALSTAGRAVAGGEPVNEPTLIEAGVRFDPRSELSAAFRMPVDDPPNYRSFGQRVVPTPFADGNELRRLRNGETIVANGSIRPADGTFGAERDRLPVRLWNGRQAFDAARVAGTVTEPRYTVRTTGKTARVSLAGTKKTVEPGETATLTADPETYDVVTHRSVETDATVTEPGEGTESAVGTERRTVTRTFDPTVTVQNRGTVAVHERGEGR
ncbi:MAG: hypothetical protein ABEI75_05160 [Halobaculum sp.]